MSYTAPDSESLDFVMTSPSTEDSESLDFILGSGIGGGGDVIARKNAAISTTSSVQSTSVNARTVIASNKSNTTTSSTVTKRQSRQAEISLTTQIKAFRTIAKIVAVESSSTKTLSAITDILSITDNTVSAESIQTVNYGELDKSVTYNQENKEVTYSND